jgi:hypothetical protein
VVEIPTFEWHNSAVKRRTTPPPTVSEVNDLLYLYRHIPAWLFWILANVSILAAWTSLILSARREYLERTILKFNFRSAFIDENGATPDSRQCIDGVPVVDGVLVTATNLGKRPITVERFRCKYKCLPSVVGDRTVTSAVSETIGQGQASVGRMMIYVRPIQFTSAVAIDTTGKEWSCSKRELKTLNEESSKWWNAKPFQKNSEANHP